MKLYFERHTNLHSLISQKEALLSSEEVLQKDSFLSAVSTTKALKSIELFDEYFDDPNSLMTGMPLPAAAAHFERNEGDGKYCNLIITLYLPLPIFYFCN